MRKRGKTLTFLLSMLAVWLLSLSDAADPDGQLGAYPRYFGNRIFSDSANPLTRAGVELGRHLFYEKALSHNSQLSCSSCHMQEKSFTDGLRFSVGAHGLKTPRNAMALVNLPWIRDFFWDGRARGLEAQAVFPLTNKEEMGQSLEESVMKLKQLKFYPSLFKSAFGSDSITGGRIVQALAQFERTLISANAPYDRYLLGRYVLTASEERGRELFFGMKGLGCGHCHAGPKLFAEVYHNNGLDVNLEDAGRANFTGAAGDKGRFRVVTLRNIGFTAPYMHDGRFETLEEVLDHYSEHVQPSETLSPFLKNKSSEKPGTPMNDQQKQDLLAFLATLNDTTFIKNPSFTNPFTNTKKYETLK